MRAVRIHSHDFHAGAAPQSQGAPERMENFLPLCSSLEREQFTLQRLNSDGEEVEEYRNLSPAASAWNLDSMDDEMYLEYLFSQGLADSGAGGGAEVAVFLHLLPVRVEAL